MRAMCEGGLGGALCEGTLDGHCALPCCWERGLTPSPSRTATAPSGTQGCVSADCCPDGLPIEPPVDFSGWLDGSTLPLGSSCSPAMNPAGRVPACALGGGSGVSGAALMITGMCQSMPCCRDLLMDSEGVVLHRPSRVLREMRCEGEHRIALLASRLTCGSYCPGPRGVAHLGTHSADISRTRVLDPTGKSGKGPSSSLQAGRRNVLRLGGGLAT